MKKYFIISGLDIKENNRGTAALGYGAFSFLIERGFLKENQELVFLVGVKRFWRYRDKCENVTIQGKTWKFNTVYYFSPFRRLFLQFGILLPFSKLYHYSKRIEFVAALNGGDGFSDIYNTDTFKMRLSDTLFSLKANIPVIILPQTLGPFKDEQNYNLAKYILTSSSYVYVRDDRFVHELQKMGVKYEITKDLSAYMHPEPWNYEIVPGSIGLNVSGLAYSNSFRSLAGKFSQYPELIDRIIDLFQKKGKRVYLIPHSYNYHKYEPDNDDLLACRMAYERHLDKTNLEIVDYDMSSPQVKYVISQMSFFCGTRMHANFAAIYSSVPVYGLAYSYKFKGAFDNNGLDGDSQVSMIVDMKSTEIEDVVNKIEIYYDSICE